MNQRLGGLKGIEKNIAYLSNVELREINSLTNLYDQLLEDKFLLIDKIEKIRQEASDKIKSINVAVESLTKELKRIDGLRNEVIEFEFRNKNKIKKYIPF